MLAIFGTLRRQANTGSKGCLATIRSSFRSSVRLQVASDLYLKANSFIPISIFPSQLYSCGKYPDYDDYVGLLYRRYSRFERIYLVLGHHEFYGQSREKGLKAVICLEVESELHSKLSIVIRTLVGINSVRLHFSISYPIRILLGGGRAGE